MNIDDPILKPAGAEIVQDIGDESPRVSKMYAQKKLPHDVVFMLNEVFAAAGSAIAAPAIAQTAPSIRWRLTSAFPKSPGFAAIRSTSGVHRRPRDRRSGRARPRTRSTSSAPGLREPS